ncbi:MAG TPA: hypothetical protein VID20_02800 [Sphingomicrobium sp.]
MKGVSVLLASILTGCSLESHESALECETKLLPAAQGHVADMTSSEMLGHDARSQNIEDKGAIVHDLGADKRKFRSLKRIVESRGFTTSIEPEEYGDRLRIDELVDSFRRHSSDRLRQLCKLGEQMHLRYNGWWLYVGSHTDYVMQ